MRRWLSLLAVLSIGTLSNAQNKLTPEAIKSKFEFEQAVAKAQAVFQEKLTESRKELEQKIEEAKQAHLKKLQELLIEETKKANLDGANAVKAEKDRATAIKDLDKKIADADKAFRKTLSDLITEETKKGGVAVAKKDPAAGPKKEAAGDKPVTLTPKMSTEKSIKEVFELEGKWQIEKDGLRLFTGAQMKTASAFSGNFVLSMTCNVHVDTPAFYRVELAACGEVFEIKGTGTYTIRFERKGDKLTLKTGPAAAAQRTIKEANLNQDFTVRVYCVPNGNFAGKSEIFVRTVSLEAKPAIEKE